MRTFRATSARFLSLNLKSEEIMDELALGRPRRARCIGLALVLAALTACSRIEPYEPERADEIPEGPGLLTGESGEFVIFRR
ncbi:MAG: hypothetical protein ACE5Q3_14845 [Alphaproteobacteria bacterium]